MKWERLTDVNNKYGYYIVEFGRYIKVNFPFIKEKIGLKKYKDPDLFYDTSALPKNKN